MIRLRHVMKLFGGFDDQVRRGGRSRSGCMQLGLQVLRGVQRVSAEQLPVAQAHPSCVSSVAFLFFLRPQSSSFQAVASLHSNPPTTPLAHRC